MASSSTLPIPAPSLANTFLKYDGSILTWAAGSTATIVVQEGGTPVDSAAQTVNFDASDFNITGGSGTVAVALNYGNVAGQPAEGNHEHPGEDITSGTLPTARLASSGTADGTTFLRGDRVWAAPSTTVIVQRGDVTVDAVAATIDFSTAFTVTSSPAGEANVGLNFGTASGTPAEGNHAHTGVYSAVGHTHAGAEITSGTVATARLGSGTANSSSFLRGDSTWAVPGGGGGAGLPVYDVVADYSAAGNGTDDDAAEIQAAIDACNTAGGGIVFLPEGTYRITVALQMKSSVILMGAGYGSVIKLGNTVLDHVIENSGAITNWEMCHFRIDGNKSNNAPGAAFLGAFGVAFNNVGAGEAHHLWIHDTVNGAFYIDGGNVTVRDNIITNIGRINADGVIVGRSGIVFDPSTATVKSGNRAINNYLSEVYEHGIKFYPDSSDGLCDGNTIINAASADDNSAFPIYCQGADRTRIIGNHVYDSDGGHFEVAIYVGDASYPNEGGVVVGNTINGARSHGILIHTATAYVVAGNNIDGCGAQGIYLLNSTECAVGDNVVRNCVGTGLLEFGTADDNKFFGNISTGNGTAITTVGAGTTTDGGGGSGHATVTYGPFYLNDIPATSSGSMSLGFFNTATALSQATANKVRARAAGRIIGIAVTLDADRTGGTADFYISVNGGGGASINGTLCRVDGTNTEGYGVLVEHDLGIAISSGQTIDVQYDTASFGPTTANAVAWVTFSKD
jgi:parallel beta-helix repeat protein